MISQVTEKRKLARLPIDLPFNYKVRGYAEFGSGIAKDISAGGLRFLSDEYIKPLTCVMFEINVLSRVINSAGMIRWSVPFSHSNRYQAGLEFLELDPLTRKYLSDYVYLRKKQRVT